MTDRIAEIRAVLSRASDGNEVYWRSLLNVANELLAEVDRVTRERDEARRREAVFRDRHEEMRTWRNNVADSRDTAEAALQRVRAVANTFGSLGRASFGADEVASRLDVALSGPAGTPEPAASDIWIDTDGSTRIDATELKAERIAAPGQWVHEGDRGVRLTHTPSGIVVESKAGRSYLQNMSAAVHLMKDTLARQSAAVSGGTAQDEPHTDEEFFRAGYAAFGVGTLKNPYRVGSSEWRAWNEGWFKAAEVVAPETTGEENG